MKLLRIEDSMNLKEAFVDCKSRLHVCRAICCKLPFALKKQDVFEGSMHVVRQNQMDK